MKKLALSTLILHGVLAANAQFCSTNGRFTDSAFFTDAQIKSQLNVPYAAAPDWKGRTTVLRLDVYYPSLTIDNLPLRPLILMVHGGGLVSGDKVNYTRVCKEFAKRGFVAVTIDYRLGLNCATDSISEEKAKYRVQQDINAAFRYVVYKAASLRVDTSWMFIGGGSAGSVAALGVVYVPQAEWNALVPGIETMLGSLNNSGNNLNYPFTIKGVFNDWGAMFKASMQRSEMLPMVSFHGDADSTVAIDSSFGGGCFYVEKSYGSRAMHNLLTANGICSDLSVKNGGGHGVFQDSVFGTPFRVGRAACFFKSLFCNNCTSFYQEDSIPANCKAQSTITVSKSQEQMRVYPVPFTDRISVSNLENNETFILLNQFGQTLYNGRSIQTQNLSGLPKGTYFLKVDNGRACKSFKLFKG